MGLNFLNTRMGQVLFERDVPEFLRLLERIADELKRSNDLREEGLETGTKRTLRGTLTGIDY